MGGREELLERGVADRVDPGPLPLALAAEIDHLAGRWDPWVGEATSPGVRARALVTAGQAGAARAVLAATPVWDRGAQDLVAAVWAVSRVGPPEVLPALAEAVAVAGSGGDFVVDDDVPLGPTSLVEGLVAVAAGHLDEGAARLARAVVDGDRRAPIWGARTRLELARVLWCRCTVEPEGDGDAETTASHVQRAARTFFAASGLRHLEAECEAMTAGVVDDQARPLLGHLREGPRWSVGFGVTPPVEVSPTKGLVALRHLVRNRHRPVPALELDRVVAGAPVEDLPDLGALALAELDRGGGSDAVRALLFDDRIRSRTTKLLRRTVARLGEQHPLLGAHLDAHVSTGHTCRYTAPARVLWDL